MELFSLFNKKTVELNELERKFKINEYKELCNLIYKLIDEGEIIPIKNSGGNGKKPTLYKKYKLIEKEEDNQEFLDEIKFKLSPKFNLDYYKKNIKKYKEHREYILKLNDFYKNHLELLEVKISVNERSFQIFGREKFIKRESGKIILKNLKIDLSELNYYETSEPIAYYSSSKTVPQNILIVENKDTYYTLRRHLLNGSKTILGEKIGTVMYGGGKSIHNGFNDFEISVEAYVSNIQNKIIYFGDLDYEGILMYESFYNMFKETHIIEIFTKGYEKMIDKGILENLPKTKEGQNKNIKEIFFNNFSQEYREKIEIILKANKYIPQEIINITDI